ncbi:hypothetical protein [Spirosoma arcticum]
MINFLTQASALTGCKNLIGGLFISATTLFANPEAPTKPTSFDTSVFVTRQGKIRLAVQKTVPGTVSVQLLDQKKHILFSGIVAKKDDKAALLFDMSEVNDGIYTLEIKSAEGSILKQVSVFTPKSVRTIEFSE